MQTRHDQEWDRLTLSQQAAWVGFLRSYAAVVRRLDAEMVEAHGLPLTSYDVLVQLQQAPQGRLRMSDLADAILLSRSGLTRLVDRLEHEGLVTRCQHERDKRSTYAAITEAGLGKLDEVTPTHVAGIRRLFLEPLSDGQLRQLAGVWRRLRNASADAQR